MKAPCGNCPFLQHGAIPLHPGRVEGIAKALREDDHTIFHCHKTVHDRRLGGDWDADGKYVPSGRESACMGALIYSLKAGHPPVALRFALCAGVVTYDDLMEQGDRIIEPFTEGSEQC